MRLFIFLIFLISFGCRPKVVITGSMLLQNGMVINGTGSAPFKGDIIVDGQKIIWIGQLDDVIATVDTIIDLKDLYISPGFIDIHAHGDPLRTPGFENFLSMGVTSIALGMDGSSVESSKLKSWIGEVDSIVPGVNILPFIGHGTIRRESGIGDSEDVDGVDLDRMVDLIQSSMDAGCWGLSMGLEYFPGYFADSLELAKMAAVVGFNDGLVTSHIRNEDNDRIDQSLAEMIALTKYCNVNISHLKVVYGKDTNRATEILSILESPQNKQYRLTADLYPYSASYTGIGIVFPKWAKNPRTYGRVKLERGEELLEYLRNKIMQRNGPEATLFGSVPYKGKTLQQLVVEYNRPFEIILRDIIGPYGASAAYFVMNDELQEAMMLHPSVMIASDGSTTMEHPRGYGTFAKVIQQYVVQDSLMTIHEAIFKMTGKPARTVGLGDRGIIQEGMVADLVVFDPENVKERATYSVPHQFSVGFQLIIIGGKIVRVENHSLMRNGRVVLKRRSGT